MLSEHIQSHSLDRSWLDSLDLLQFTLILTYAEEVRFCSISWAILSIPIDVLSKQHILAM